MSAPSRYDIIIIGGGPAGLSAGLYTARAKLKTLIIEGSAIGGRMAEAWEIENYPGFTEAVHGYDLGQKMYEQATKFGAEHAQTSVTGIRVDGGEKIVTTPIRDYAAPAVIIAGGSERRKLGVPGETELTGRGVSFCATCDGPFFREKAVAVVGGGNGALNEATHISHFASKVYVIHRRDSMRATKVLQEKAFSDPKIEFIWNTEVTAIEGKDSVERLKLKNVQTGAESALPAQGVFIAVGLIPNTGYLQNLINIDQYGAVLTNDKMETNVPGIYAAGDVRANSVRQVVTAAGDGATAALYAQKFISENAKP
ncbi:thioredoxin-disulfide reductase [Dehalogenimonas alkenigignens]|uniref:Thioredoxin reductase n=1 Tax=Dehalogenimonas alkenigignens TaxID=1217799 RepID=A0A0W0GJJ7_9CHLR|nr:thioredoxin-disulfide reductase [Dehalogenimonas alkenigignens]KTB48742.1 thioredoxin-disulfide reductase [Dehalogenimonas alkenigignens]PVV84843.1 thioredoxin-disulfide reductase [Dehalogenimonas alkenigignens]